LKHTIAFITILTFINVTFAEECIDHPIPDEINQLSRSLGRVNCHTSLNFMMDSNSTDLNGSETCGNCKDQFLSPLSEQHIEDHERLKVSERRVFIKTLFNELQKSIAITTAEVLALNSSTSTFSQSLAACNTNSFKSRIKNCPAIIEAKISVDSFSNSIAESIAKSLKPLKPAACSILEGRSQSQLDQMSLQAAVQMLDEDIFNQIASIDINSFSRQINDLPQGFQILLSKDPVFKALKQDPQRFKNFFASIRSRSANERLEMINSFKESEETNLSLDTMFKNQCEKAYASFADTVCAADFSANSIDLGSLSNYSKVNFDQFDDDIEFATDPKVEARNFELLSFCGSKDNPSSKYNLNEQLSQMNSWMQNDKKPLTLQAFDENMTNEKAAFNQQICETDCSVSSNSTTCFIKNLLQTETAQGSSIARTSYSGGALELIRSITGTPSKLSVEDKEVLVSYGILPQDDGSYITPPTQTQLAQTTTNSGSNSGATNRTVASSTRTTSTTQFADSQNRQNQRGRQSNGSALPYNPISSSEFSSAFADRLNDLSDLTDQERQRLNQFEEEITRRLSRSSSGAAPTRAQVQQVAQSFAREQSRTLSPQRQQQFVNSYVGAFDDVQNSFASNPGFANSGGVDLGNDLAGPSQAYTNAQNAREAMARSQRARSSGALSGSGGADSALAGTSGRSPASTTEGDAPSVSVRISLDELQLNPQRALSQLPASLPETFIMEIQGTNQVYRYQIQRSGLEFQVSQIGGSNGRALIERIQRLLRSRRADLTGLRRSFTGVN